MDALTRKKEKAFHCNDIVQKINEISGTSRRHVFNIKSEPAPAGSLKLDYCTGVSLHILRNFSACNFIKSNTPAQVLFCEFCEIFKNTYFVEHCKRLLLIN